MRRFFELRDASLVPSTISVVCLIQRISHATEITENICWRIG